MIDFGLLKRIEKKENLFKRKYRNVNYWQMVRLNLVYLVESRSGSSEEHKVSVLRDNMKYCLQNMIHDRVHLAKAGKCDILYFDQCSYSNIDGELKDTYFDFFDFEKDYNVYRCYYLKKGDSKKGVGISVPLMKYYLFRLLSKIVPWLNYDKNETKFIRRLDNKIKQYGNDVLIETQMHKAVLLYKAYKPFYDKLLKKCSPEAVFVVCHYDEILFPLYSACREKGIPVIELQHGLAAGVNAYTYDDLTEYGKQLPSHIFTYGEIWDNYIHMPEVTKVMPIGNPYLENRKERYKKNKNDNKKIVVYSFPDERDRLVDLSMYLAEKLRDYKVLLKLHPREIQYYVEIEERIWNYDNLQIVDKNVELYELLSTVGHHIAISSTVLYEAAIFKCHRYVYSRPVYISRMQPLIDAGLAAVFYDKDEIIKLIQTSDSESGIGKKDNLMWKENAAVNAKCALNSIISGQI